MKNKTFKLFTALLLIAGTSLVYTGCKKEEDKPADYNAATDNSVADNAFAGIWKQISTVTDSSGTLRSSLATSAAYPIVTITEWNTTVWPKILTIDFGPTNILGNDGNNRRGSITAEFTGPYLDSATVITISLTNYYHNDYKITGTQTITNLGHNTAGHLVYNVVVNNATVTHPTNGQTSTWSTNQNREFIPNNPLLWLDDVYLITGTANGVSGGGSAYSIVVNSALRVNVGCRWIVSGAFTLTLADYPNYPIGFDYGNGNCDALATATLNGTTYNIVMN